MPGSNRAVALDSGIRHMIEAVEYGAVMLLAHIASGTIVYDKAARVYVGHTKQGDVDLGGVNTELVYFIASHPNPSDWSL